MLRRYFLGELFTLATNAHALFSLRRRMKMSPTFPRERAIPVFAAAGFSVPVRADDRLFARAQHYHLLITMTLRAAFSAHFYPSRRPPERFPAFEERRS